MIFAVESASGARRWISALLGAQADAVEFIASLPIEPRRVHRIIDTGLTHFPVFILEGDGFEFCSAPALIERLRALVPAGDAEYVHMHVYASASPFMSLAGRDEMGRLPHWHVSNRELSGPRRDELLEAFAGFGAR